MSWIWTYRNYCSHYFWTFRKTVLCNIRAGRGHPSQGFSVAWWCSWRWPLIVRRRAVSVLLVHFGGKNHTHKITRFDFSTIHKNYDFLCNKCCRSIAYQFRLTTGLLLKVLVAWRKSSFPGEFDTFSFQFGLVLHPVGTFRVEFILEFLVHVWFFLQ